MSKLQEIKQALLDRKERPALNHRHLNECSVFSDMEWLIEQLEQEIAKTKVELWNCPDCGFGFDAGHTDVETGDYSCPCCAELELTKQLEQAQQEFNTALDMYEKELDVNQKLVECLEGMHSLLCQAAAMNTSVDEANLANWIESTLSEVKGNGKIQV